ncbi:pirin family protein [Hwanghaeella grinnelliae]|uniref:Pirin family protein n=1 Tax=Hwanghaeella grinnelliae TaxID=2500179 RepID=A0A3S2Z6S4_9PROT|nr:pirin family protein [Hwanghaeella grinnelliae]RVU35924.1 pirin family protein [Hwanghaeella grinnelliae]
MNNNEPKTDLPAGIEMVIAPRTSDIGSFEVQRLLPHRRRRMVGPFIFADRMGPSMLGPSNPLEVRPHPHIGLSTVTYLFDGEIVHRDSLGFEQTIRPGAVNLMIAGRGIVHSERSDPKALEEGINLFGMQIWMALPHALEETDPAFINYGAADLPAVTENGATVRLVAGSFRGETSPVETATEAVYADITLPSETRITIPADYEERALYPVFGSVEIRGTAVEPGELLVLVPGQEITVRALQDARLVLLGGEPMDGPRHVWWNLVSSSKERIEQAKEEWKSGLFPKVPGDDDFIPLPE